MRVCLRPCQAEQQLPGKMGQGLLLRMPNESRREARRATKGARVRFVASSALAGYPPITDAVAVAKGVVPRACLKCAFTFGNRRSCLERVLLQPGLAQNPKLS